MLTLFNFRIPKIEHAMMYHWFIKRMEVECENEKIKKAIGFVEDQINLAIMRSPSDFSDRQYKSE